MISFLKSNEQTRNARVSSAHTGGDYRKKHSSKSRNRRRSLLRSKNRAPSAVRICSLKHFLTLLNKAKSFTIG